jgi:hypothetical protein
MVNRMQVDSKRLGLLLLASALSPCFALNSPATKPVRDAANFADKVAIMPWAFDKGTLPARKTADAYIRDIFTKSLFFREDSYSIIPEERVVTTWTKVLGFSLAGQRKDLPTAKQLLNLGKKLGVDWVVSGRAVWHTRRIWIGLGPKTKSDCAVDMVIVDVKNSELSLDARNVVGDSTAKEDPLTAGLSVALGLVHVEGQYLTLPITAVSGGPKTPREQSAVQIAIAKAIQPWLAVHPRHRKIEPDD